MTPIYVIAAFFIGFASGAFVVTINLANRIKDNVEMVDGKPVHTVEFIDPVTLEERFNSAEEVTDMLK